MQALHILPDGIVQPQFTLFAKLHDSGRGVTLGMRRDPKPVAWGKLFAGRQVGVTECVFSDDLAAMRDSDDAAGLLRPPHLEFDPVADISGCGLHPWLHMRPKMSASCSDRRCVEKFGWNFSGCYRTKQNRRNLHGCAG